MVACHLGRSDKTGQTAFTLIELLSVIGIIALLIGLLLPTVSKVRVAAQKVATQGDLNRLSAAIDMYFQATGSYPGVNPELQMKVDPDGAGVGKLDAATQQIDFANYPSAVPPTTVMTGTENMMVSLLGGLRRTTSGPSPFVYDLATVGQGPASLNPVKPGRMQPFLQVKTQELSTSYSNPAQTMTYPGQWNTDSAIPEMLDSFAMPHPILYMRARRGSPGTTTGGLNVAVNTSDTAAPECQYDVRQLTPYGFPLDASKPVNPYDAMGKTFGEYFPATAVDSSMPATGTNVKSDAGAPAYFDNAELTHRDRAVVLHKDTYILISAGPDGFYGTSDDIRN